MFPIHSKNDDLFTNAWRRRFAWGISAGVLAMFTIIWMLQGSDNWTVYNTAVRNATIFYTPLFILQSIYSLIAELRDRAIRQESERERRWQLLERLAGMSQDEQRLARLILEEDINTLTDYEIEAKPKRQKRHR